MAVAPKKLYLKGMEIQENCPGSAQNCFDLELVLTESNLTLKYGTPCISPKLSIEVSQMTSFLYSNQGFLNISYETHEFCEGESYKSVSKTIEIFCWSEDPNTPTDADENQLRNFLKMYWTNSRKVNEDKNSKSNTNQKVNEKVDQLNEIMEELIVFNKSFENVDKASNLDHSVTSLKSNEARADINPLQVGQNLKSHFSPTRK